VSPVGDPGTVRLVVGLSLLTAIAIGALVASGVRLERSVATAVARAAIQLSLIGLVLRGALSHPWFAIPVLLVMLSTAIATSASRLGRGSWRQVAVSITCGLGVVLAVAFSLPVLPRSARYLIALAGIVIGNAMTAVTLSGRSFAHGLVTQRDEVEAWLSIGATHRQAAAGVARKAITDALIPGLDQTRTVGLVALPGTYIGALLGGASAGTASRFQLVTLVGILTAQAVGAAVLMRLRGAPVTLPAAGL
jgi:putative ABC transport system permease protein